MKTVSGDDDRAHLGDEKGIVYHWPTFSNWVKFICAKYVITSTDVYERLLFPDEIINRKELTALATTMIDDYEHKTRLKN